MRSKILTLSSIVVAFVLALTCGLVLTLGSTPNTDANAAASHTDHEGWTDLNSYGSTTLASGKYYLSADFTGKITLASYANVILCLNGYTMSSGNTTRTITVAAGQKLTVEECNTTAEHQYYVDSTGLWKFDDGTEGWDTAYAEAGVDKQGVVKGGIIAGGGISVSGGTFTLNGGTISGIAANRTQVVSFSNSSTFTMNGGAISGNTTISSGSIVSVVQSTFAMEGGSISNNSSAGSNINCSSSTTTMNGGTISGNTAKEGGGMYNSGGTFTMTDGSISSNKAREEGGGVYNTGTFTMTGGTISGNTAKDGGGVYMWGKTFTMTGGTIASNNATSGGGVYVYTGTFNMDGGTIKSNTATNGGGIYSEGILNITNGTISDNTASQAGGGIYAEYSALTISGGTISGNTAASGSLFSTKSDATIAGGKLEGTINYNSWYTLTVTGGRFALANTETDKVCTDTAQGDNGVSVSVGYEVVKDNADPQYPYIVQRKAPPATVSHEGTDGWYKLSEWLEAVGPVLADGKYFVDKDIVLTDTLTIEGEVTLCLNGHKLAKDGNSGVISGVSGVSFTLEDCNSTRLSHDYYVDETGLWVFNNGQEGWQTAYDSAAIKGTVQGGVITGASGYHGGGVSVESGTFIMNGGTIAGNKTTGYDSRGAGVYLANSDFTMNGGAIRGNTAEYDAGGAGVSFNAAYDAPAEYYTFVMNDGLISDNVSLYIGGGITVAGSKAIFNMLGGTISNNTAGTSGGGIFASGSVNITGGTISGNTSKDGGSAVNFSSSSSTISGGNIDGTLSVAASNASVKITGGRFALANVETDKVGTDTADGDNGIAVYAGYEVVQDGTDAEYPYLVQRLGPPPTVSHEGTDGWYKLSEWIARMGLVLTDGKYFVDQASITLTGALSVEGNATLCLDGNKLVGNGSTSVITVQSGYTFTLQDCNSTAQSHQYYVDSTGLWVFNNGQDGWQDAYDAAGADKQGTVSGGLITGAQTGKGGGVYVNVDANFVMSGGTISGNKASGTYDYGGGGVHVDGTFTMSGGAISGNTAQYRGGGVFVNNGASFIIADGTISHNTASSGGGGVYATGSELTLQGGTISHNTASSGGGLYATGSELTLQGVTISNNTAKSSGGGVYVTESSSIIMSGGAISDNTTSRDGGGLYLTTNSTLMLTDGTISGNQATQGGGAVYLSGSGTTFTMNGGTINTNTATGNGGAVSMYSGTFTMNSGTISGNTASSSGGAVYMSGGTFTLNDGTISDNTATNNGAGVLLYNATFTMNGGTISGHATSGVELSSEQATFNMLNGYMKDNIVRNYDRGTVKIAGGYFAIGGDVEQNTIQGFDVGTSTVKELTEEDPAYQQGYRYLVDFIVEFRIDTLGNSQYKGSAIANKDDFTVFAIIGSVESPNYDFVFQYAPQGTEDFVDGLPSAVGVYTIKVTLNYLGKETSTTFDFEITKRVLTLKNIEAVDRPYDGTTTIQLVGTLVGAIEGDDVQLVVSGTIESANVGNDKKLLGYEFALSGADSGNYDFAQPVGDIYVNITPRQLEVNWSATQFTYNEKLQQPTATVDTGVAGETVTLVVTAEDSINVGTYTATAAMETANGNYVLSGETLTYSIAAKKVTVNWGETEFVYDGKAHTPTFTIVDENGNTVEVTNVTVTGGQTEIGTYTASVYLNDNYIVDNASITFTILQQPINTVATWGIIGGVTGVCLLTVGAIFLIVKRKKV